jgi:hypothetical protein
MAGAAGMKAVAATAVNNERLRSMNFPSVRGTVLSRTCKEAYD